MAGIRVELQLQSGEFTSRMIHAGETVRQFQANVGQAIVGVQRMHDVGRGFLSTLRDLSIVTGTFGLAIGMVQRVASGWAGQIVQVNAEMERLQVLLSNMSSAADPIADAAAQVRYLRDFAKQAPFSLNSLTNAFVKMKATGMDPLNGSLRAFVDGVAAAGGSEEMLNRAAIAISQMSGKGVIQMEELRQQLGEAIPRAIELMARSLGTTYSDLVDQISTGRVLAEPALEALRLELDRTFGGAANSMMQTFAGQIARTKSLLQDLAIKVGDTGYFDAVKVQLGDLNAFLESDAASVLADKLGQVLSSIVNGLRNVIEFVIEFRQEIILTGKVLAAAFLTKLAIGALTAFGRGIMALRANMAALALQASVTANSIRMTNMAGAIGSFTGGAAGIGRLTQGFRNLGSTLSLVGSGLSFVGGWMVPLAGTVMMVANAFGIFSDKARDAWQELEEFGAQSMEQVLQAGELLARKEAELARLQADARAVYETMATATPPAPDQVDDYLAAARRAVPGIEQLEAEVAAMRAQYATWTADAAEKEADRAARAQILSFERVVTARRLANDLERQEMTENFEDQLRVAEENEEDTAALREEFQQTSRDKDVAFYENQLALLEGWLDAQNLLLERGSAEEKAQAAIFAAYLLTEIQNTRANLEALAALPLGVQLSPNTPDSEALIEKAQEMLTGLRTRIAGVRAEMRGASSETAEFLEDLANGVYGPADTEQMMALRDAIVDAQDEYERLKRMMEGQEQFNQDVTRLLRDSAMDLIEARTGELDDLQKLAIAVQLGDYPGVGAGMRGYEDLVPTLEAVGDAAEAAGVSMTTGPFGAGALGAGNDLLTLIGQLTDGWAGFRTQVNGTDVAGALRVTPNGTFMPTGAAAEFIDSRRAGSNVNLEGVDPAFLDALARALQAAEAATGQTAEILSLFRTREEQQRLYDAYLRGEIGLAAPPGNSRHEFGAAADLNSGAVLDWLHANAAAFGLAFLQGDNFTNDPGHIQMAGPSPANAPAVPMTVPPSTLQFTLDPNNVNAMVEELIRSFSDNPELQAALRLIQQNIAESTRLEADNELNEAIEKLIEDLNTTGEQIGGIGTAVSQVQSSIRQGMFGEDTNISSARYREILDYARSLDALNERADRDEENRNAAEEAGVNLMERRVELQQQLADSARLLADPDAILPSSAYTKLVADLQKIEDALVAFYGRDSDQFRAFMIQKTMLLGQQASMDTMTFAQEFIAQNQTLRESLMNQAQARQNEHERDIARMREHLRTFQGTAEQRAIIEEAIQERMALARQEAWSEGAFAQAIESWTNFGENIENAFVGWVDTMASTLADFIVTGEADWAGFFKMIATELAKLAIQAALGNIFKNLMPGDVGGGGGLAGRPILSFLAGLFGIAHTGGIVGSLTGSKSASPLAFAGAPRFHTGGIVDGLNHDEVPIIAKRGEGVFTPEQMSRLGGTMNSVVVQNHITVNGNGGSGEQNTDLAEKIGRELDQRMRKTVAEEIITQRRPGGMLYGRR